MPDSAIPYSGEIRGESAIMNERMIGQSVNHTFQVSITSNTLHSILTILFSVTLSNIFFNIIMKDRGYIAVFKNQSQITIDNHNQIKLAEHYGLIIIKI